MNQSWAIRPTGVEREPDSMLALLLYPTLKRTHTHHPNSGVKMQAQETHTTQENPDRMHPQNGLPRKEVIQPHLPVRLPCYDFVPIANPTFDHSPRKNG